MLPCVIFVGKCHKQQGVLTSYPTGRVRKKINKVEPSLTKHGKTYVKSHYIFNRCSVQRSVKIILVELYLGNECVNSTGERKREGSDDNQNESYAIHDMRDHKPAAHCCEREWREISFI